MNVHLSFPEVGMLIEGGSRGTGLPIRLLSLETKFPGVIGDGKKTISPVQLTTSRIGNHHTG